MSQDLEQILRKSLDEADRYRRRVVIVFSVLAGLVAAGLGCIDHLKQTGDIKTMLFFSVGLILVAQVAVGVVTWGVVATAARRILKAIELLSKE